MRLLYQILFVYNSNLFVVFYFIVVAYFLFFIDLLLFGFKKIFYTSINVDINTFNIIFEFNSYSSLKKFYIF